MDDGEVVAKFRELTGARTILHVPMLKDEELLGIVSIYRQEVRPFTGKQIDLVKNFVVHDNPERLDLFICEGIEDAASIAVATGLTCWAAGSAGRIPTVLPHARSFDAVFVAADGDFAGRRALQLAREKRPDIITLDFGENDANATLEKNGAEAILSAIDRAFDHHHSAAALQLAA